MTIRIRRDHILVLALILAIFGAGLGAGWFLFGRDAAEVEAYYRGVFDLCGLMVAASGQYMDCQQMTAALHGNDFYGQTQGTDGWTWPLE